MGTRVLIAEDEVNIAAALSFLLEREGYNVACVEDGRTALARIEAEPPALLLLDVMLPKLNGLEVLRHVRATPGLSTVKVLVLTAKGQDRDRRLAAEAGADAFLSKPFSNAEVVARARALAAP